MILNADSDPMIPTQIMEMMPAFIVIPPLSSSVSKRASDDKRPSLAGELWLKWLTWSVDLELMLFTILASSLSPSKTLDFRSEISATSVMFASVITISTVSFGSFWLDSVTSKLVRFKDFTVRICSTCSASSTLISFVVWVVDVLIGL